MIFLLNTLVILSPIIYMFLWCYLDHKYDKVMRCYWWSFPVMMLSLLFGVALTVLSVGLSMMLLGE